MKRMHSSVGPRRNTQHFACGIGSVFLCLTSAIVGCKKPERTEPKPTAATSSENSVTIDPSSRPYIRVAPAEPPPATASRSLFARIAFDERKVSALGVPVSGRVTTIKVATGDSVKKGSELLTVQSADVASLQSQVAEAKHLRLLAEQTATRARLMEHQGAGTQAEVQQAETALHNAQAEERRAQEATAMLGKTQGTLYTLRSPIDGTVVDRAATLGITVMANQGAPLITVADLSTVWVLVDVYEQDLPYVKTGNKARIEITGLKGRQYEGTVAYVGDVVDSTSRSARARIELRNDDRSLRPGMFALVHVHSTEPASAWVPKASILARRDEFYVFIKTGIDTFTLRKVTLGHETGDHVAILTGVAKGEPVVVHGAILLDAEANSAF